MANYNSATITNFEMRPIVLADSPNNAGNIRVKREIASVNASHNNGDTYALFTLPLIAFVDDIQIIHAPITGGTNYDFGVYQITNNSLGAAIDADILADGVNLTSAREEWSSIFSNGANSAGVNQINQALWQIAGYASYDAAIEANKTGQVYCVMTASTVGSTTADVGVKVLYSID